MIQVLLRARGRGAADRPDGTDGVMNRRDRLGAWARERFTALVPLHFMGGWSPSWSFLLGVAVVLVALAPVAVVVVLVDGIAAMTARLARFVTWRTITW